MKTFGFRQKPLGITIHIISWFLIFFFPIMLTEWGTRIDWEQYLRHSFVPLCSCFVFYINYLHLVPRYLFQNSGYKFLTLNIIMIIGMSTILHFGQEFLFPHPEHEFRPPMGPPPPRWMFLGSHLLIMAFVVGLSTALRISMRWQYTEERLIKAEREKTETELKNLKNQLNPHFLLNTLNNIYALIVFDHNKAQEAVQELSKMLRHVLYDNQSALVSLEKELDFINNYISLMRIRLPKTVKVSVKLNAGNKPLHIAPLIFISLIENAFKHGISPTEDSFINISIQGHPEGKIYCEITNSYFPKNETDKSGSGIGLAQVHRRLELSYPNSYEWTKGISADGKTYTSCITIQTPES